MGRLFTKTEDSCAVWSTGSAEFYTDFDDKLRKIIVGVQCRIGEIDEAYMALLDTGATWSIIGGEMAQDFEGLPVDGPSITINSRFGDLTGDLKTLNITLVANHGDDLLVESTVFISKDWPGSLVLGFHGFLEKLRIALDPGLDQESSQVLYFGRCE
jgi:hypothetical protein